MAVLREYGRQCDSSWERKRIDEIADMVERDYVSRAEYERATHDAQTLYLQVERERDNLRAEYDKDALVIVDELDRWKTRAVKLKAQRDEWKAKAKQAQESYIDAKECRDEWMAKYKQAELRSDDGVTNLDWLIEHDRDGLVIAMSCDNPGRADCGDCAAWKETNTCLFKREWLMAPYEHGNGISDNLRKSQDSEIESCRQYADQPKREEAPDCESDSREKLEADVRGWTDYWDSLQEDGGESLGHALVFEWLDRQAAIDERYWKSQVDALVSKGEMIADGNTWLWSEAAELQEKVDEQRKSLEAAWEDNAELIDQLESAHAKNRALKAHISKMQEGRHGWHVKGKELQEKVDALTQANADYREEWHRVCRERDDLQRKLHESNREREQLRKQLGIAIDHAHDMIALVNVDTDEGAV